MGQPVFHHGEYRTYAAHGRPHAEHVERLLVARVIDAGDYVLDTVLLGGKLADDDIVLVVTRDRDDVVGPSYPGFLQDAYLRAVAHDSSLLEFLLESGMLAWVLLDYNNLKVVRQQLS